MDIYFYEIKLRLVVLTNLYLRIRSNFFYQINYKKKFSRLDVVISLFCT